MSIYQISIHINLSTKHQFILFFKCWPKSPVGYLGWLCKLFDKALNVALARGALAMCLQIELAISSC